MFNHDALMAKKYIEQFEQFAATRAAFESHWQDLAENIYPRKGVFGGKSYLEGRVGYRVYDGTPVRSLGLLTSALHTMVTNPATQWFLIETFDEKLMKRYSVQKWAQTVSRILFLYIVASNFHSQVHEFYTELGLFGNASLFVEEDDAQLFRFSCRPMSEVFWQIDHYGQPREYIRSFELTPAQMAGLFGVDALHEKVRKDLEDHKKHHTAKYRIMHYIAPRAEWEPLSLNRLKRQFESVYVDIPNKHIMKVDGYHEQPHGSCRWEVQGGGVYGRGPADNAILEARLLHISRKHYIRAVQKATDPALMVPEQAFVSPLDLSAGAVNYYKQKGSMSVHHPSQAVSAMPSGANFPATKDEILDLRQQVRESFFVDQLKLAERDRMTTIEVHRRVEEGNRILAPVTGRMNTEALEKILQRCFWIALRRGVIPPPPPEVQDARLQVKFVSPLARSMKLAEVQALSSALDSLAPLIQVNPQMLDNLNYPALFQFVFNAFGAPLEVVKDPEEMLKKIKEQEEAQMAAQQQQQMMEGAAGMSGAIKDIASATKDLGGLERVQRMVPM